MADEFKVYMDPSKDPHLNDDSQPSDPAELQRKADERAGVKKASIPAPADAIDLAYRSALADVDPVEVGRAVAAKQEAGVEPEDIDVEEMGEGSPKTTKKTTRKGVK
jgi:hypothetical protein